jgi:membrane-associated protease RseP (regulator of RpoE activity)
MRTLLFLAGAALVSGSVQAQLVPDTACPARAAAGRTGVSVVECGRVIAGAVPIGGVRVTSAPVVAGALLPPGWIGIALSCSDCVYGRSSRPDSSPAAAARWSFATPPEVYSVELGSPAHAAGIRRGDVVTHVDDHLITSEAGGRRWAQIRPGETVRLRYRRGSATRFATVQAAAPQGIAAAVTIRPGQAPVQLRALETTLAQVDSASVLSLVATERRRQEQSRRDEAFRQLYERSLRELRQELQRGETTEALRRVNELLRTLSRDQAQLQQQRERQLEEARTSLLRAQRLQASVDSIGRAVTALGGVYARALAAEQRLRYSGTFGGTDIEVRSVIPIVVTETANEVTIRAGDTLVTLKRPRQ